MSEYTNADYKYYHGLIIDESKKAYFQSKVSTCTSENIYLPHLQKNKIIAWCYYQTNEIEYDHPSSSWQGTTMQKQIQKHDVVIFIDIYGRIYSAKCGQKYDIVTSKGVQNYHNYRRSPGYLLQLPFTMLHNPDPSYQYSTCHYIERPYVEPESPKIISKDILNYVIENKILLELTTTIDYNSSTINIRDSFDFNHILLRHYKSRDTGCEIDKLKLTIKGANREIDALKLTIKGANREIDALKLTIKGANREIDILKQTNSVYYQKLLEMKKENDELKKRLSIA